MTILQLLLSFIKIGLFGFGGGQSMIPLIEDITVKQYGFITQELFLELVATANVLPGPIGTKLAVAIGYHTAGYLGVFVSLFAIVLPSSIGMIIVIKFLNQFSSLPIVVGLSRSASVIVVALILGVAITLGRTLIQSIDLQNNQFNAIYFIIFLITLVSYLISTFSPFRIPTALIVLIMLLFGSLTLR
jgi:chromate transporter